MCGGRPQIAGADDDAAHARDLLACVTEFEAGRGRRTVYVLMRWMKGGGGFTQMQWKV